MKSNQHIHCSVASCQYNEHNTECALDAIQVAPCPQGSTGQPEDESLCASYHAKR